MKKKLLESIGGVSLLLASVCAAHAAPLSAEMPSTPTLLAKAQYTPDAQDVALAQKEVEFLRIAYNEQADADFDDYSMDTSTTAQVADPLEGWNRFWFNFNDGFYTKLADPIWRGYAYITPEELRAGTTNFFHNIAYPIRFLNCLLQGKFRAAGVETSRFIIDSTVGLGGLMKPSSVKKPVVDPDKEDFGQTLGVWGAGEGFYIVWPFLGPSTLRDTGGLLVDVLAHPLYYLTPMWHGFALEGYRELNRFGILYENYMAIKAPALEPYTAIRDAYIQMQRNKVDR